MENVLSYRWLAQIIQSFLSLHFILFSLIKKVRENRIGRVFHTVSRYHKKCASYLQSLDKRWTALMLQGRCSCCCPPSAIDKKCVAWGLVHPLRFHYLVLESIIMADKAFNSTIAQRRDYSAVSVRLYNGLFHWIPARGNDFNMSLQANCTVIAWMISSYSNGSSRTYFRSK